MQEAPRFEDSGPAGLTLYPGMDVRLGSNHDFRSNASGTPAMQKRTCEAQKDDSVIPPKKARLDQWLAIDVDAEASVNVGQVSLPGNQDQASATATSGNDVPQVAEQSDAESLFLSDTNSDGTHQGSGGNVYAYPVATSIYGFTLRPEAVAPLPGCYFFGNQGKEQHISYDPSKHFRFLQGKNCPWAQYEDIPGPGTVAMHNVGYVFGSDPKRYSAYERAPTTQLECGVRENQWLRAYALKTHYIEKNVEFVVGYTVKEGRFDIATVCVEDIFFHKDSWGQPIPEDGRVEDYKRIVIENIARQVATIKEAPPGAKVETTRKAGSQIQDSPISTVNNATLMEQALWHLSAFEAPYQPAIAKYMEVLCRTAISDADSDQLFTALRELNLTNADVVEIAKHVNDQKTKAIRDSRAQIVNITRPFDSTTDLASVQALNNEATNLLVSGAMCRSMNRLESFMHAQSLCVKLMQLQLKNQEGHGGDHNTT